MTKKTELKTLFTKAADNLGKALSYAQEGSEGLYNSYLSDASSQAGQIEYLLGNREAEFDAKIDQKTAAYGCSDAHMDAQIDNGDFLSYQRCIGISKLASLEVVDEMF